MRRALKWVGGTVLVLFVLLTLTLLFGLHLLKDPLVNAVNGATGRELTVERLKSCWNWIHPCLRAEGVAFTNAGWGRSEYLLQADAVQATFKVLPLLAGRVVLPEVHLERAEVSLEQDAEGRKNWVMKEKEEEKQESRVVIELLTLDQGQLAYVDEMREIDLEAELSTDEHGVRFAVEGIYNGMDMEGRGHGGPVLSLRDQDTPYPLKADLKIGRTAAKLDGTITGFVGFKGIDLQIESLSGRSLDELYHIVRVAFPATSPYTTRGRLVREGKVIRYDDFQAKIGESDLAGSLQVDTGGERPVMTADIQAKVLNFADLGPLVGTDQQQKRGGVLPDAPFDAERWGSVNADVRIRAGTIKRPQQLPLERLTTRIRMQDKVLSLEPLEFGIAGGRLAGTIRLDGNRQPIGSNINMSVRDLKLAELFPTIEKAKASVGAVNGLIELTGAGDSVAQMMGSANGKIGMVVDGGEVSKFLMNAVAIDLWGLARTKLEGDEPVEIRCAIADFSVKNGVAQANALVFDTAVVNVGGDGRINLKDESMDLTLRPEPKDRSVASLNTPLYIRGTFSKPEIDVDAKRLAVKGAGAVVMGILNPLLAVIPLFNKGEGKDSPCQALITAATKSSKTSKSAATSSGRSAASGATKTRPPSQSDR